MRKAKCQLGNEKMRNSECQLRNEKNAEGGVSIAEGMYKILVLKKTLRNWHSELRIKNHFAFCIPPSAFN